MLGIEACEGTVLEDSSITSQVRPDFELPDTLLGQITKGVDLEGE